jgi:hypothetical protein
VSNPAAAVNAFVANTIPGASSSTALSLKRSLRVFRHDSWGSVLNPIFSVFPPVRPAVATPSLYVAFWAEAKKFRQKRAVLNGEVVKWLYG